MTSIRVRAARVAMFLLCLLLLPLAAFARPQAQATVRVTSDGASIWRPGFLSLLTVVNEGTELEVVGRQGAWLEVVAPAGAAEDRRTGLIALRQVTLVSGTLPPEGATPGSPGLSRSTGQRPAVPLPPLDTGVRGFVDIGFRWFAAHDSFSAVLDEPGGVFAGGGAEVRWSQGLFVQGAVRYFEQTGERAFVLDDEVFRLGIADTIRIVPVSFTAGYRARSRGPIPYIGGGFGFTQFRETSELADASENIDESYASYHVLGGAEWRTMRWLGIAAEAQYTFVPDALTGGLADLFDEHDLGGFDIRVKVVIGR